MTCKLAPPFADRGWAGPSEASLATVNATEAAASWAARREQSMGQREAQRLQQLAASAVGWQSSPPSALAAGERELNRLLQISKAARLASNGDAGRHEKERLQQMSSATRQAAPPRSSEGGSETDRLQALAVAAPLMEEGVRLQALARDAVASVAEARASSDLGSPLLRASRSQCDKRLAATQVVEVNSMATDEGAIVPTAVTLPCDAVPVEVSSMATDEGATVPTAEALPSDAVPVEEEEEEEGWDDVQVSLSVCAVAASGQTTDVHDQDWELIPESLSTEDCKWQN